jgi:hypothetical protein
MQTTLDSKNLHRSENGTFCVAEETGWSFSPEQERFAVAL